MGDGGQVGEKGALRDVYRVERKVRRTLTVNNI